MQPRELIFPVDVREGNALPLALNAYARALAQASVVRDHLKERGLARSAVTAHHREVAPDNKPE